MTTAKTRTNTARNGNGNGAASTKATVSTSIAAKGNVEDQAIALLKELRNAVFIAIGFYYPTGTNNLPLSLGSRNIQIYSVALSMLVGTPLQGFSI